MIVRELIEQLSKCDPDAPVLVYVGEGYKEDDFNVCSAQEIYPVVEEYDDETYIDPPYYCQGYGIARHYWKDNGPDLPVVVIGFD